MHILLSKHIRLVISCLVAGLFFASSAYGQAIGDYRSNANGNWSTLGTWQRWNGAAWVAPTVGEGYPGEFAIPAVVTIRNLAAAHTVNMDVTPANNLGSLNIEAGNQATTLTIVGANVLSVNGAISIDSGTGVGDNKTISVGGGTLTGASLAMAAVGGGPNRINTLTVSTGTVTIAGNITMNGTAARNIVNITGAGTLNVAGDITGGDLITALGSTVDYNGGTQTVRAVDYGGSLILSGSGTKDLTNVIIIDENFTMSGSAAATITIDLFVGGNVTLESGTSFTVGPYFLDIGGDWINNGATIDATGSLVNFYNGGQIIGGTSSTTFDNVSLTAGGTISFGIQTFISGNLSIDAGAIADLGTITTHSAGTLTLDGNSQASGTWGSTSSSATNQDDGFFAATVGIITVNSAEFYSIATGNWNANTTWSFTPGGPAVGAGIFPLATDIVNITGGFTVTVNVNSACATMNFVQAGNTNAVNISPGVNLSVSGTITIPRGNGANTNTLAVGAGSLNAGSITFTNGGGGQRHFLTISTGTATISGDVTQAGSTGSATIAFTGAGLLQLGGAIFNDANGTLTTVAGSTVEYNAAGDQTVGDYDYQNLTLSGGGIKTLQVPTNLIGGNFTLNGTTTATGVVALTIGGNVTLESGTTFTAGAFTHNVAGNWVNNGGTFVNTGSTINFGAGTQNIGGSVSTNFNNLTLSVSGTKTFGIETFVDGTLSISGTAVANLGTIVTHTANALILGGVNQASGTWGSTSSGAVNTNDTYFASTTGIITIAAAQFYSIASGNWNANTTWSFAPGGPAVGAGIFPLATDIVNITGGFNVTVNVNSACATLTFVQEGESNTVTISPAVNLTVSGAITIPRGNGADINTLAVGAGSLNAGSIAFTNGGGGQRHLLTISTGTATVSGDVTQVGSTGSASITFTGAGLLQLGGAIFNDANGTLTMVAGSTVEYNAAGDQTVGNYDYQNLTLSGGGIKTLQAATNILGGNFTMNGTTTATGVVALTIGGNVTLESGTTFTAGAFTHNVAGNWVNNGTTFNNTGSTINLNNAGAQSIGGSVSTTFNNLTLSTSGTKTFGIATFMDGTFAINGTAVANLGAIVTHTANALILGGVNQASGTWGSTSSGAVNTNDTYFAPTTGIITIAAAQFYTIATGNWNANTTWSFTPGGPAVGAGLFPTASDLVNVTGGYTVTVTANAACASLTYLAPLNVNNTITINPGISLFVTNAITLVRANNGNSNTLAVGDGSLSAGSIAFTNGGGGPLNRHQLTMAGGNVTVTGDITTDNAGISASIVTGTGTLNAAVGILTTGINGGTLTTSAGSTVNYNGANQTIKGVNYNGNLSLTGSGVKTLQVGTTTIGGNLTLSGSASTTTVVDLAIGGNLIIGDGTQFTADANAVTVGGTTTVGGGASGQLIISSATGAKTFTGLVTVSAGGTWTNDLVNCPVSFEGGITNNGTFLAGTGLHTFQTNNQQLTGIFAIPNVTVTGVTLTNNNSLTVATSLSGTGGLTQAINAVLNIGGTSALATLTASNAGNTVNYNGTINQTVITPTAGQYANLAFNGTTATGVGILVPLSTISVSENWVNNGTGVSGIYTGFNPNGGTVIFNGISTVSGTTITGFHNVQLTGTATLTFPAGDVNVSGDIDFAAGGVFNNSNGRVVMNDAAAQAISANGAEFYTIQVNKSGGTVDINSSLPLERLLDIQTATAVNSNNNLLLLSRGATTDLDGAIGALAAGASVNGNITMQRYMDAISGQQFRYLGSPVSGALPPALWGTNIQKYVYNVSGVGSYATHSTSSPLVVGTGYVVGRTMTSPITWAVNGPINNSGSHTWTFNEAGWHLVANPFPSAIRWYNSPGVAWDLTNIATTIAVTDNDVAGYPNYFRYWSYNPLDDPTTWGTGPLTNGMVAMGQAFWVYVGTGGGTLTIYEQAKENAFIGEFYKPQAPQSPNVLKITLDNGIVGDVAYLKIMTGATGRYEFRHDLKKLWNPEMNLYLSDEDKNELVISAIEKLEEGKRIPLELDVMETGEYNLSFAAAEAFTYGGNLFLIDTYEEKTMPVTDLKYTFTVNESPKSQKARFYLSMENILLERNLVDNVEVYPNPVKDKLFIRMPSNEKVSIKLTDTQGKEIISTHFRGSHEIDMREYPEGMYVLRLFTKDEVVVQKILR
jgi:hypothetical protein